MKKTPMQKLIEKLRYLEKDCVDADDFDGAENYMTAREAATELLEKEREDMIELYADGILDSHTVKEDRFIAAEQYFNETYER